MKTTVDLPDALLREVKKMAARQGRTLRDVLEESLRRTLDSQAQAAGFRLRRASFKGEGLQAPFADGDWDRIRQAAYEGRGT